METFIRNIFLFIRNIFNSLNTILISGGNTPNNRDLGISSQDFLSFLNKNVFMDNSLIGINITFKEMFIYVGTLLLVTLFIVLFVKFILKLVSIFRV